MQTCLITSFYILSVWYRESLPIESPPSYRGTSVKYSYKITIATQKVGSHIKMVRIPFRVLPISPIMNLQDLAALCGNETTEELQPTNPFSEERKVETPLTMALQVLQVRRTLYFAVCANQLIKPFPVGK